MVTLHWYNRGGEQAAIGSEQKVSSWNSLIDLEEGHVE